MADPVSALASGPSGGAPERRPTWGILPRQAALRPLSADGQSLGGAFAHAEGQDVRGRESTTRLYLRLHVQYDEEDRPSYRRR